MITIIVILILVGVGLYLLELIPMDATVRTVVRVLVIVFAILYVLSAFGLFSLPVPMK